MVDSDIYNSLNPAPIGSRPEFGGRTVVARENRGIGCALRSSPTKPTSSGPELKQDSLVEPEGDGYGPQMVTYVKIKPVRD